MTGRLALGLEVGPGLGPRIERMRTRRQSHREVTLARRPA